MAFFKIGCLNYDAPKTHFAVAIHSTLQADRRMVQFESAAVCKVQIGIDIHHSKPSNKTALATIQLVSEVTCLPSKVSMTFATSY